MDRKVKTTQFPYYRALFALGMSLAAIVSVPAAMAGRASGTPIVQNRRNALAPKARGKGTSYAEGGTYGASSSHLPWVQAAHEVFSLDNLPR